MTMILAFPTAGLGSVLTSLNQKVFFSRSGEVVGGNPTRLIGVILHFLNIGTKKKTSKLGHQWHKKLGVRVSLNVTKS